MKKKRLALGLLLSVVLVAALNGAYLKRLPINVMLEVSGKGCGAATANFSKKAEGDYSSRHKQTRKICLNAEKQKLIFHFDTKKIKNLTLAFAGRFERVEILDYKVGGGKVVDLTERLEQKRSGTVLTVNLTKPVNIRAGYAFNEKMFVILLTLICAAAYKLLGYLSELAAKEGRSRTDIVFVALFFTLLFVPMLYIDDKESSEEESRRLATVPDLLADGSINQNFGRQFDRWFGDHFLGRKAFIGLYNYTLYGLDPLKVRDQLLVGKNGWEFSPSHGEIANFQNNNRFSDSELKSIAGYLSAIDDWCRRHGKRFYFYIAPSKHRVYPEYYRHVRKMRPDGENGTEQLISYLRTHTRVKVMYPLDILLAHKKDGLMYWKNDTHWSLLGGYYGYVHLMRGMGEEKRILSFDRLTDYKYPVGNISNMYRFLPRDNTTVYQKPDIGKHYKCNPEDPQKVYRTPIVCTNPRKSGRIIMFRDSFSSTLIEYLAENYAYVAAYWYHALKNGDIENIEKNADIVIFEKIERDLHLLNGLKFVGD